MDNDDDEGGVEDEDRTSSDSLPKTPKVLTTSISLVAFNSSTFTLIMMMMMMLMMMMMMESKLVALTSIDICFEFAKVGLTSELVSVWPTWWFHVKSVHNRCSLSFSPQILFDKNDITHCNT